MDLGIQTETFTPSEDQSWLGSAHATENCMPITLDSDAFIAAGFNAGIVPSGVVVGIRTTDDLAAPYADAGANGLDTAQGHLFTTKSIRAGTRIPAALYWHGSVIESKLPASHGLTTAAKADLKHIRYRA